MARVPEKVYVPNVPATKIYFLLRKYQLNHLLIQCLSNILEWVDLIRCDSVQRELSQNLCDSKLQNFCAQNVQLTNDFLAQHFRKFCCLQGFHFHFFLRHAMARPCMRDPSDGVKDVTVY